MVMVLVTLAVITSIVLEIISTSQVSATIVVNHRDGEKAYQLARAAVRWSMFRLQLDTMLDQIPEIPGTNYGGRKDDPSEFQWAVPISYPFAFGAAPTGEEGEAPKVAAETSDIGGTFVSVLEDESARINLNDVGSGGVGMNRQWSGAAEVLENLILSLRFQPYFKNKDHRDLLWAIDDWTDNDSEVNHLGGGIEDAEYQVQERPDLNVKNGPFYSLEEVRQLKPMTDDLFLELKPFITVYPFNAATGRSSSVIIPSSKINVNTAPLELIAATLSRQLISDERARLACAQAIVKYREGAIFRKKADFIQFAQQNCVGGQPTQGSPRLFSVTVNNILDVRSDVFRIEATGSSGETEKTIRAVVLRPQAGETRILYWKVI